MKTPRLFCLGICLTLLPCLAFGATHVALKLDPAKAGAPINPFIYGQFIEHLGRCIYGGIWAEMLEDRKFYFPVTAEYSPYRSLQDTDYPVVGASPWQIIGNAQTVSMVKESVMVGEHAPRIKSGGGLRQRDLGVVSDLKYVGYLWGRAIGGAAELEISLAWGPGRDQQATQKVTFAAGDFAKQSFELVSKGATERGASLEIRVLSGDIVLGPPSLMPGDNVRGMRRDTLALLKKLNGTVYRWPGGNFVSGYDWRDGIGDRDRRPPRKNPAWTGVEHNDFGTDEFIDFCREVGTEPMIAANTGFGDAYSAAQWVEYCNAGPDTVGGGWRVKNGHPTPYQVKNWCVGNEMWGAWQLGYMQLPHYVLKHNQVADAMWKVDPKLVLVAVGDFESVPVILDQNLPKRNIGWSHGMLEGSADHMTMISEHFYRGRLPWTKDDRVDLQSHVGLLRDAIRKRADDHRALQSTLPNLKGRIIPIAMDEWNYWHREYVYGELGCIYELSDGLGVAAGLHEFFRQSDIVQMAHYAQTVNVIGAIKTSKTAAEMETTGLVLQLYRAEFGQLPLLIDAPAGPYDVAAALTQDGKKLTVGVMNPTKEEIEITVDLAGRSLAAEGTRWHITGKNEFAHNTPGKPRTVDIHQTDGVATSVLKVPALSASVFAIPLK
jgi:alpha-N-arabinofuranosidase